MLCSNWPKAQNLPSEIPSKLTTTLEIGHSGRSKELSKDFKQNSLATAMLSGGSKRVTGYIRNRILLALLALPALWLDRRALVQPARGRLARLARPAQARPTRSRSPLPLKGPPTDPGGLFRAYCRSLPIWRLCPSGVSVATARLLVYAAGQS